MVFSPFLMISLDTVFSNITYYFTIFLWQLRIIVIGIFWSRISPNWFATCFLRQKNVEFASCNFFSFVGTTESSKQMPSYFIYSTVMSFRVKSCGTELNEFLHFCSTIFMSRVGIYRTAGTRDGYSAAIHYLARSYEHVDGIHYFRTSVRLFGLTPTHSTIHLRRPKKLIPNLDKFRAVKIGTLRERYSSTWKTKTIKQHLMHQRP